ncbi:MAG: dTDP-4-dehydrorhamnose 3,5-epimerase family protein [Vicinamibacterales bacterium]
MAKQTRVERRTDVTLLDRTLAAAIRDVRTVTDASQPLQRLTEGVRIRPALTHADERGTVVEMFDPRWGWHPDPIVFAYSFTIRPGIVKGWNLHKEHEDRYFILQGEMELVLFDPRPDSPTCGEVCRIVLSEHNRCLVNVPPCVWHADHNIGTRDVVVVNFPTSQYNHASPDKYRLPIDTDLIPHSFPGARGW